MMMMQVRMVMIVAMEMFRLPSRILLLLMKVVGKDFGFAPQIISAVFCSR